MPRKRTEYLALLSAPGGLEADKEAIRIAVDEINSQLQHEGLGLLLRDWKRDVSPGATNDAQDKINQEIVDSVDVVVALLHTRIGQPTPRFGSGTIEEIERTLGRRRQGELVEVMVYFKKEKVDPDSIDLDQLAAVREFREKIRSEVLYIEYSEIAEMTRNLRLALPTVLRKLNQQIDSAPVYDGSVKQDAVEFWSGEDPSEEVEEGALDVADRFNATMSVLSACLQEGGQLSNEFVEFVGFAQEDAPDRPADEIARIARDRLEQNTGALESFNERMESVVARFGPAARELPLLAEAQIPFLGKEIAATADDVENLSVTMHKTVDQIDQYSRTIQGVRDTLAGLPRLTKRLNLAKRRSINLFNSHLEALVDFTANLPHVADKIFERSAKMRSGE